MPVIFNGFHIRFRGCPANFMSAAMLQKARLCFLPIVVRIKVKLHYAYKVRNIGRVRPKLRCCAVAFLRTPDSAKTQWFVYVGMAPD